MNCIFYTMPAQYSQKKQLRCGLFNCDRIHLPLTCLLNVFCIKLFCFRSPSRMAISRSYPGHLVKFCERKKHLTSFFQKDATFNKDASFLLHLLSGLSTQLSAQLLARMSTQIPARISARISARLSVCLSSVLIDSPNRSVHYFHLIFPF